MATEHSFDVVSKVDRQEVRNAIQQARKEIQTRFDLKGTGTEVRWDEKLIEIVSSEEMHLESAYEILRAKLARRGVPLKALRPGPTEKALGGAVRQRIELQNGIPVDKARQMVKMIKASKRKVQVSIQGDQVRVSGKNKDDLQAVIALLRETDLDIDMQFTNYR